MTEGKMETQRYVARISELRAAFKELIQDCELPQIEAMLRNADMELHWALWNLGAVVPLRPEPDYEAPPPGGENR
jgi:hypothetical protein